MTQNKERAVHDASHHQLKALEERLRYMQQIVAEQTLNHRMLLEELRKDPEYASLERTLRFYQRAIQNHQQPKNTPHNR